MSELRGANLKYRDTCILAGSRLRKYNTYRIFLGEKQMEKKTLLGGIEMYMDSEGTTRVFS
jgi:hypothetical protein